MKWLLLLLPGGCLALIALALWRRRRAHRVSDQWLREIDHRSSRVEFISVSWNWPVGKAENDDSEFQRARLRRSA